MKKFDPTQILLKRAEETRLIRHKTRVLENKLGALLIELTTEGRTARADKLMNQVGTLEFDLFDDCPTAEILEPLFPGLGL